MRRSLPLLALAALLAACAGPPQAASPSAAAGPVATSGGIGTLSPAFRDYRTGTRRSDGSACTPAPGALRYVESLEYLDGPPVVLGVDAAGCVAEVRMRVGAFEHAAALATQRLGAPRGEDRATCAATGAPLQGLYWDRPEGRFALVRAGVPGQPEFVLRPAGAPLEYPRLCDGAVTR